MEEILVDLDGYVQFKEELEKLKIQSISIASVGSEAYSDAVGDGWHDNFAFEESMRESRTIASKINKMLQEQPKLKVVKKKKINNDFINIDDVVKVEIIYSEDDIEVELIKLTGKYLPNIDAKIKEVSLNSPLGKAIYKKKVDTVNKYTVNDKTIYVKIIEKVKRS